jgi:hypothetical protein
MDTETIQNETSANIAALNDAHRKSRTYMFTRGVWSLENLQGLIVAVQNYDSFTEDNDPYGEHDFGSLEWDGKKVFWKIDYYDQELKYGLDPLDPKCNRVLTVLLSEEY